MDISSFVKTAASIPPHIAILLRGSTGIGKSAIVNQIGKKVNKPVIDVRGSTMSEGDVIGYPDLEGMKVNNVMTFCMPSWFARCCKEPVILFLDEMNRSLPQVQQAFFQIVLDRMLGNDKDGIPYEIHPETQVIAAINYGAEYDVNDIDPALLRRFWTCDIEPDLSTWMDWAKDNNIESLCLKTNLAICLLYTAQMNFRLCCKLPPTAAPTRSTVHSHAQRPALRLHPT